MKNIYIAIVLAPLIAAAIAGLYGNTIGRNWAHRLTIFGVAVAFVLSCVSFYQLVFNHGEVFNQAIYTWMVSEGIRFEIGFLVDQLTVMMMVVVTGVSLAVHVYTIGYMHDDPGYQRFFSYISLFTFSMLMLVMSNNLLQLFFGWEAVGLVSYLLIGFWFKRPTAVSANLKAFVVNRVGDFGFILGIAAIVWATGTLNYAEIFGNADQIASKEMTLWGDVTWPLITVACILLFIGAMGKSAQFPLHVWLPDSMEGPTPISALIHAATMVTAGIFMVARMSPLFELSEVALSFVLIVGAITAFFMGLIGMVQHDIKRVVAYSTLSQLGYMVVALGVSAYSAALFHLMTHAFFKALLFLSAGSVIMAMHHEQDMRKMGGLWRYMPITYAASLIGSLALIGFPGFSGFFSKDAIIEAVHHSHIWGAELAYWMVLFGVFITAFYSFRMFFVVFHGEERMDHHTKEHLHETPWVVTGPLIALAIPSVIIGAMTIGPMLFGHFFHDVIYVKPEHDVLHHLGEHYHGWLAFIAHGFKTPALYLAFAGVATAWFFYLYRRDLADKVGAVMAMPVQLLQNKYYADEINDALFSKGSRGLGGLLWKFGDAKLVDGLIVNGSAKVVGIFAALGRYLQTGYLYHYAFAMILGLLVLLTLVVWE